MPDRDHLRLAHSTQPIRRIFVRDLTLNARIGGAADPGSAQRVRINLDLGVLDDGGPRHDRLAEVVCYETIADGIRALARSGHVTLVETLAERIAALCLRDPRVRTAKVRVERLDGFPDATSVGVEIERHNR